MDREYDYTIKQVRVISEVHIITRTPKDEGFNQFSKRISEPEEYRRIVMEKTETEVEADRPMTPLEVKLLGETPDDSDD